MLMIKKDPAGVFHLQGAIDDRSEFAAITGDPQPKLILDFDQVNNINSFGIRKLALMVAALKGKQVTYRNVRPPLAAQFNMIDALVKGVTVESMYLPYECSSCDLQSEQKVATSDISADDFIEGLNEHYSCPKCSRKLTFMEDEGLYFNFLKSKKVA